ncbi:hypothetical protein [Novosphingobium sp.]|uniref:hypothetical protein n=1 Tax=Novosphingobium sp. TaxID=1874826 RepID=UPI0038BBFDD4
MTMTIGTSKQVEYAEGLLPYIKDAVAKQCAEFLAMGEEFSADERAAIEAVPAKLEACIDAPAILTAYHWDEGSRDTWPHRFVLAAALGEYQVKAIGKVRDAIATIAATAI